MPRPYDNTFDPFCTDVPPVLYACFIGDGYADVQVNRADDDSPESSRYWYTPRNSEQTCPTCDGTGKVRSLYHEEDPCETCDEVHGAGFEGHDCETCDGSGTVTGEPFTVTRYTFPDEDTAAACWREVDDAGDGYDRAGVLARYVREGRATEAGVVNWSPDYL